MICLTPGTLIATARGEVPAEMLSVGDKVITRDNGIRRIRWIGHRDISSDELEMSPQFKPVLIRSGSLGDDLPNQDIVVSPNHRILLTRRSEHLMPDGPEILTATRHFQQATGIERICAAGISYVHIMFDERELFLTNGLWSESFHSGDMLMDGVDSAQRMEILSLFPELARAQRFYSHQAARRGLSRNADQFVLT